MRDDSFYENLVRGIFGISHHDIVTVKEEGKALLETAIDNLKDEEKKSVILRYDGTLPRAMRKLRNPRVSKKIREFVEIG